jgi:uncharacterized membrane-anchored protein
MNREHPAQRLSKVPEVTLTFWILKILATTLGETGGDAVSMTFNAGYLDATFIFVALFAVAVGIQIRARSFQPSLYWFVIVATTTAGTTMADFADRSLGIGYTGGSLILLALLIATLALWYRSCGSVSVETIVSSRAEAFYWATILFSQTLGTALGDWMAAHPGVGYGGGVVIFAAALLVVAGLYFFTRTSRTTLFWAAFILTRPLGATLGDLLDKPHDGGGFGLSRVAASAIIAIVLLIGITIFPQRAERVRADEITT